MNKHFLIRVTTLVVMLGLAVASLLLLFLLLGRSTVGAASERAGPIPDVRAQNGTFTVSGTVMCEACGATRPISDVEVYVWDREQGTGVVGDTTDSSGHYSVTLDLPPAPDTYSLEFTPPPATGLNARAFTTIELVTNTVVNVDFCVCNGVWISETVDSAGDVGGDTSLALAPTYPYTPHISYHDGTNDSLKHAWLSGTTWLSEKIDSGGDGTSLALVPTPPHTPRISYHDYEGLFLRYAWLSGTIWITMPVAGRRANSSSLALEPTDPYTPHISYYQPADGTLMHVYLSGTIWMPPWSQRPVEPFGSRVGFDSSIALEPTDPFTPHISYRDWGNEYLKHAWKMGTTWLSETVDDTWYVGFHTSLALDSSNNPHISYYDLRTYNGLKYAWLSGTTWFSETVDSMERLHVSRNDTSLELDQADAPHISYYDATNGDLKYAHFDGTLWIIQTVDSEGSVGGWSSLALDQADCPHISYSANDDLKYAYVYYPALDVIKQADPDPVEPGTSLTYTLWITNTGNVDLHVTVTDTLPAQVTPTGTLTWTPTITASGGVWTEQFTVTVEMDYIGPLVNVVEVTTEEGATGIYTETSISGYIIYLPIILKSQNAQDDSQETTPEGLLSTYLSS